MSLTIKGSTFTGGGTAIKTVGPIDINVSDATFDNVQTPFDVKGAAKGDICDNRIINDPKLSSAGASSGWTKARDAGPPLPCFCSRCKSVFKSGNYVFSGMYFNLWGNKEECPKCGNPEAFLSEGVFSLVNAIATIIRAPDMTYAMFQALTKVVHDFQDRKIDAETAVNMAIEAAPALAKAANSESIFGDTKNSKATMFLEILAIALAAAALLAAIPGAVNDTMDLMARFPNAADLTKETLRSMEDVFQIEPGAPVDEGGYCPLIDVPDESAPPNSRDNTASEQG